MYINDEESANEQRLRKLIGRIIRIGFIIGAITMLRDIWLYFQAGVWQVLVAAGGILLAFLCLLGAHFLVKSHSGDRRSTASKRSLRFAAYAIILGVALSYGAGELAAEGIGLSIAVSGALLIVLLGLVLIPRQWVGWLVMTALYSGFIWWVNRFEPVPRYDISQYSIIRVLVFGTLVVAIGVILWQLYRTVHLRTLHSRLLVAFTAVVLLPVLLVDGISAARGSYVGRRRLLDSLNALSMLKETELNRWVARLKLNLNIEADRTNALARALLQSESGTAEFQAAHEALLRRLQQTIVLRDDFEEFLLMDQEGYVILSTDKFQEGELYNQESYFQKGLEELQLEIMQVHSLYSPSLGNMAMILSRPVLDNQGQSIGVLAAYVNMLELDKMMRLPSEVGGDSPVDVEFHLVAPAALVGAKIVDRERPYILIASSVLGQAGKYVYSQGIESAVRARNPESPKDGGAGIYENHQQVSVIGTQRWLPDLDLVLLTEEKQALAFRETRVTVLINLGVTGVALLLAGVISLFITRNITEPLIRLAEDAARITSGDLQHTTSVNREDEIGVLAHTFNRMTTQLRDLISNLEERVAERALDLERRSHYLAAAAEVGGVVGTILDPQQLTREVVTLMRRAFGFQYVGLFTLDEAVDERGQSVVLQASAGELESHISIAEDHSSSQGQRSSSFLDETSLMREVVLNKEARVLHRDAIVGNGEGTTPALGMVKRMETLSTTEDGLSQAILPLRARNEVLGVLSIYASDEEGTQFFDEDMINILQMVADQIAVALENARLFEQNQEALETARRAYGELVGNAWAERFERREVWGYRYIAESDITDRSMGLGRKTFAQQSLIEDNPGRIDENSVRDAPGAASEAKAASSIQPRVIPVEGDWPPKMIEAARLGELVSNGDTDSEALTSLALPIKSHGRVIGVLNLRSDDNPILPDQISLLEDVTNRLGLALENARLLEDSRQRAAREQLTANLAARMREPLDVESVLRTAARELYEGLGLSKVRVRLLTPGSDSGQTGDSRIENTSMLDSENLSTGFADSTDTTVSGAILTEELATLENSGDLDEHEE